LRNDDKVKVVLIIDFHSDCANPQHLHECKHSFWWAQSYKIYISTI